jgi:peptidoglycan/LPS O-acetylase OafA/YrhL
MSLSSTGTESVFSEKFPKGPNREPTRFPVLDGLRGLAAVGVAIFHYMLGPAQKLPLLARATDLFGLSPLSLDTFFILSGFLIGGILLRIKDAPNYYKAFYQRRFFRILPLYYFWIALFCVVYFAAHLAPPHGMRRSFYLASYIFLFQSFFPAIITSSYMLVPTWTLVAEEHFYLLIPICIRRMSSRGLVKVLLAVMILAPLFRAVLFTYIGHESEWADMAVYYWPPCRADALAIGVLLAVIWRSEELREWLQDHVSLFIWGMLAGSGLAILLAWMADANFAHCRAVNAVFGRTAQELACLGLIAYLICRPQEAFGRFLTSNIMCELGKISYCIYIVHWGVLWMIFRFVLHTSIGANLWLDFTVAPIALLISIAIAQLSWKYFELPLLQRARGVPQKGAIPVIPDGQTQIA